jgi:glycerophosphoryl diester phosphodiesterase
MLFLFCSLLLLAAVVPAVRGAGPLIVGHRGASGDAPENTLAAFRLAWEQGADGIEGDYRLSADGRVVCVHDADMKRLAGVPLVVRDSSFEQLRALDVGSWKGEPWAGEKIPALEEVLAEVPAGKLLVIELKTGPEIVEPLAAAIERSTVPASQILLIAFDDETIAACKRRLPDVKCHWLTAYKLQEDGRSTPTPDEVVATIRRIGADGLGSESKPEVFNEVFVRRLRAGGVDEFHVWTVDDPEVARFYRRLGAWGLTTNRPGKLREELED